MERTIIKTADGSHTVTIPEMNVSYHSKHGAILESMHVFIEAGLRYSINQSTSQPINIFEMGFGTGLNAFLTAIEATNKKIRVHYISVEKHPLTEKEVTLLNYTESLKNEDLFEAIHKAEWSQETVINEFFTLGKIHTDLANYSPDHQFNIIYYDAFAPSAQPELWKQEIFETLLSMLSPGGILVTYCSKGEVRRAMQSAGFEVEKIPGPPGKREMVRAVAHPDLPGGKATIAQHLNS
jgi:tRNA U34 5-methylaminomethyl-2-thiouridine-forming methyltransferase MnmC